MPTIVHAGDPAIVEVDIEAEKVILDVDIVADESTVYVNGVEPSTNYLAFSTGADQEWVEQEISDAVVPLYSWIDQNGAIIDLTLEGLAKVIIELELQRSLIDGTSSDLDQLIIEFKNLFTQTSTIKTNLTDLKKWVYDNYQDNNKTRSIVMAMQDSISAEMSGLSGDLINLESKLNAQMAQQRQELLYEIELARWESDMKLAIVGGTLLTFCVVLACFVIRLARRRYVL